MYSGSMIFSKYSRLFVSRSLTKLMIRSIRERKGETGSRIPTEAAYPQAKLSATGNLTEARMSLFQVPRRRYSRKYGWQCLGGQESVSSEHLAGCCERLPLAFLIASEVPAQHRRRFPARDQHHVALAHSAAQGYTGECAPQVVTNTYGGLGLPTRRRSPLTFTLRWAG